MFGVMPGDLHMFPTTHWSLVVRAGKDPSESQRDALGELLQHYIPAMRTYVVCKYRVDPERADELVAGFLASRIVEKNLVGKAEQGAGKFRNFLMTALQRYVVDRFREESALKRGGDQQRQDVMERGDLADGDHEPAAAFEAEWARDVVAQAIARMRASTEQTRPDLWGVFSDRVLGPAFDGSQPSAYVDLVQRLGFTDEGQAANALHTAKRIFARILRSVVAEYEQTASDIDDEVGELMKSLGKR
jgi:RNA polymerase sigma-70 factor (ECF subfamily)